MYPTGLDTRMFFGALPITTMEFSRRALLQTHGHTHTQTRGMTYKLDITSKGEKSDDYAHGELINITGPKGAPGDGT